MQYHKLLSAPALRTLLALPAATIAESTESAGSATTEPMFGDYQAKGFLSDYSRISKTKDETGSYEYVDRTVDYGKCGILVLIGGGVQLVDAFHHRGWQLFGKLLVALLYFFVGATMLMNPLLASATLTLMIAWALLFIGLMRMIAAFQMRGMPGWVWTLIGGIGAIVLCVMIMNRWPVSGLWVIGMFVAIELIFNGWGMIMTALAVRNLASRKQ